VLARDVADTEPCWHLRLGDGIAQRAGKVQRILLLPHKAKLLQESNTLGVIVVAARSKHDRLIGFPNDLPGAFFSPAIYLHRDLNADGSQSDLKVQLADIVDENSKPCQSTIGIPPQMYILPFPGSAENLPQIKNRREIPDSLDRSPRNKVDHRL
jgi:hypothetical protein